MDDDVKAKLDFYPAYRPTGTGVIILPGGGYSNLSTGHEGAEPARWLNGLGIDAWVLRYTVVGPDHPAPLWPRPLDEAAAAVRAVRRAGRVRVLGLWGFSAGGHLAAMTATTTALPAAVASPAPVDFAVLAYPVISMESDGAAHEGSVAALLGPDADMAQRRAATPSRHVTPATPPVFLFHTAADAAVPVQNSLQFATALAAARRPFELFVLPEGAHGLGLPLDARASVRWDGELARWLRGFVADE